MEFCLEKCLKSYLGTYSVRRRSVHFGFLRVFFSAICSESAYCDYLYIHLELLVVGNFPFYWLSFERVCPQMDSPLPCISEFRCHSAKKSFIHLFDSLIRIREEFQAVLSDLKKFQWKNSKVHIQGGPFKMELNQNKQGEAKKLWTPGKLMIEDTE